MSSQTIRPSTMEGIKRLAKSLRGELSIKHLQALDAAAQVAGFQNFRHARNQLRAVPKIERFHPGHRVFLTSCWKDRNGGGNGRETLSIWLSAHWGKLITPRQLKNLRSLENFRVEGPDHLACEHQQSSQSAARRAVCAAARALNFMDATKLRPSRSNSRAVPGGRQSNAVPGCDHYSVWYDRHTKRYLFADEPYEKAVEGKRHEREIWAKKHGYVIVKPQWAGMYAPDGGSRLYLISHETKGIALEPVAAALDKLPAPIVEASWDGESDPMAPSLVSSGTLIRGVAAKGKPRTSGKEGAQRNSVAYVQILVGPKSRPKGRMPIEAHAQVGCLLKSVLRDTYHRKGVYNRINAIRSELDEWIQREYNAVELPNEQFLDLYYRDSGSTFSKVIAEADRERHVQSLAYAKKLLSEHYPDCPPLRSLLTKVDAAVQSLRTWN